MLHISGWYDSYAGGTVRELHWSVARKRGPVRLIMGPWTHGGNLHPYSGDVAFGPDAPLVGFDAHFTSRGSIIISKGSRIAWCRPLPCGSSSWARATGTATRTAASFMAATGMTRRIGRSPAPISRTATSMPMAACGRACPTPRGRARPTPTTRGAPSRRSAGLLRSVPDGRIPSGAYDQRERPERYGSRPPYLPLRARRDILVFQTPPLAEDVTIAGPIVVNLYASSTAVDTDFTVKLIDVYPPSAAFPVGSR